MKRAYVALVFLAGFWMQTAHAADFTVVQSPPMIGIGGEIGPDDFALFKEKASSFAVGQRVLVDLYSPGGNLVAGLEIGEFIRAKGWATFVYDECDSACALIWLAGKPRGMSPFARVGFHAASVDGKETGDGGAVVGAYMTRLGLGYAAVLWANKAGPKLVNYLTVGNAKKLGIDVTVIDKDADNSSLDPVFEPVAPGAGRQSKPEPAPTTFDPVQWRNRAIGDAVALGYVVVKSWQTNDESTGNHASFDLLVTWGKDRLVEVDYDGSGNASGGSVCDFDVLDWSSCRTHTGTRYLLNQEIMGQLLRMGTAALDANTGRRQSP